MRRIRRRVSQPLSMPEITLTPLIDTALVLLLIFMVATPIVHNALRVELPRGKAQEVQAKKTDLVISVDSSGALVFENEKLAERELFDRLSAILKSDPERVVYVNADRALSYGTVVELVDRLKHTAGVKYVALATRKPESANRSSTRGS